MVNRHYEKRMKEHRRRVAAVNAIKRDRERQERAMQVDTLLSDYEQAYRNAYDRRCHLVYRNGWVHMAECATFRVRLKNLGVLAQELRDAEAHDLKPALRGAPTDVLLD